MDRAKKKIKAFVWVIIVSTLSFGAGGTYFLFNARFAGQAINDPYLIISCLNGECAKGFSVKKKNKNLEITGAEQALLAAFPQVLKSLRIKEKAGLYRLDASEDCVEEIAKQFKKRGELRIQKLARKGSSKRNCTEKEESIKCTFDVAKISDGNATWQYYFDYLTVASAVIGERIFKS